MGIVDLDLLFQSPQEDARIVGGMGEEERIRGSTMEVNYMLKKPSKLLGKKPLLKANRNMTVGSKTGPSG